MIIKDNKAIAYRGFGYNILSEINLPELFPLNECEDKIDIVINEVDLTNIWSSLACQEDLYAFEKNRIMFKVPNVAIYSIEDGEKILVSPFEGSDEDERRLYILGTCMGAILMQRKVFPLHGSAISINGKAYAIVGESGAGKSTLATAFINRGYKMLSDDVIALTFLRNNAPFIIPSYPQQKLWEESLNKFGMECKDFLPLYGRETKFSVPVSLNFSYKVLPLAGIIELVKSEDESIKIQSITGLERLHTIYRHTYRNQFIQPLGIMEWHFKNSINIINHLPLYQLKRPTTYFTAPELVNTILTTINEE